MKWENFSRWFNRDFWRAFRNRTFPIFVPGTGKERAATVRRVFDSIATARYAASIPETEIVMNKGHGVTRTVPVFCIEDYITFYFCIKELEEVLCGNRTPNTFGGWSLGGRMRKMEDVEVEVDCTVSSSRYSFNPRAWAVAFGEFNSLLFAQVETGNCSHILQFDLSNFYDCVRLDILERWIREEAPAEKGWIIALLFYFLNKWNRRNTGLHPQAVGLPQDAMADCSRILANYYLQKYDRYAEKVCSEYDVVYFRYADDQMLLTNRPEQLERLMLLLTRNLDRYGLRVNQKKVNLYTSSELLEDRCRSVFAIFSVQDDTKDKALVRKFVDAYFAIPKAKLRQKWNGGRPMLNRLLFANIESLPRELYDRLVSRFTNEDYLLIADSGKLLRVSELNSRRKRPIDLVRRLSTLAGRVFHNSFHYEVRDHAKRSKNGDLFRAMEVRIAEINLFMAGTDSE